MPWRGPEYPGAFPTLGYDVADWIEAHCVIPDGDHIGQPFLLSEEQVRFLLHFYRLRPDGKAFHHTRGGILVRPQKWGKGPFSAAVICAEGAPDGPVLPAGFDADGEPVGRPWATPLIQVTAASEGQTDNVWSALQPMIELGALAADIDDTGLTRINLPHGGKIEPVTASAKSRLGARITFSVQDEALALDTPIPTPVGWSTVAELAAGDTVLAGDGTPATVVRATDIQHGRTCYRLTFADGTSIVASDGHLWLTRRRGSAARPAIRTTGEMVDDGDTFRVPRPRPWQLPTTALPVDPYFLGVWLGDGSTGQTYITAGDQDVAELRANLEAVGIPTHATKPNARAWRLGFSTAAGYQAADRPEHAKALQQLPCYRSKHIPPAYLRGDLNQRTALLQGLMDTDGSATESGHCSFVGTHQLASDVVELLRTLGQSVRLTFRPDPRSRHGGTWRANFKPRDDLQPFRLARKAARVQQHERGPDWVTITDITPTTSVPVRCIEIDHPDHLFLAGLGGTVTHNTHSWTKSNGGRRLADTQRRNLAGMGGRFLGTTNAPDPNEIGGPSVADDTLKSPTGVHVDYPPPPAGKFTNKRERRRCLRQLYRDCTWVNIDRIDAECIELINRGDVAQAERFFGNRRLSTEAKAFDGNRWDELLHDGYFVDDGELIVVGVDGAKTRDALALIGCEVQTGYTWPILILERPDDAPEDYVHDLDAVDAAIDSTLDRFDVWRAYIDPGARGGDIGSIVADWTRRYGKDRIIEWLMHRERAVAEACRALAAAIGEGELSHDGDPTYRQHVTNADRDPLRVLDEDRRPLWRIKKPAEGHHIDAAAALVIAWEARTDAIAAGAIEEHRKRRRKRRARGF